MREQFKGINSLVYCNCSIGYLTELKNSGPSKGRQVEVDFPEDHDWSALYDEIERVPPEPLKVNYSMAGTDTQRVGCAHNEISLIRYIVLGLWSHFSLCI